IRCIHTHPNGDGQLSTIDLNSMLGLNLDAIIAIGVKEGRITVAFAALPEMDEEGGRSATISYGPFYNGQDANGLFDVISDIDKQGTANTSTERDECEKAILVGLELNPGKKVNDKSEGERSLEELEELALTAGLEIVGKVLQKKSSKDSTYYIGKGKVEELCLICQAEGVDTLVFDDELSGAQIRNIEKASGVKVVDRTTLILDIFAQRARSSEGKLQVELAQLKYRLPRLMGFGNQLSRLGGGIGTRGPGEKQLEVDRRHIRRRIGNLEDELEQLGKRRGLMRVGRRKNALPVIALVGYTNSGKSTLLNTLCSADVFAEDKLFATLDPTARRLVLPEGRQVLLVDTVGFIRKLPHELVDAFKSTLEEVAAADLLLHVVDAADEEAEEHIPVVEELLKSLNAFDKPTILVLNKMDIAKEAVRLPIFDQTRRAIEISAKTGSGLEELQKVIAVMVGSDEAELELLAPFDEGWVMPYLHESANILEKEYTAEGVRMKIRIDKSKTEKIRKFVV
ncbi:MAG: GTPase HflX, partial [Clostridiales bacterium]|nr:GTPase HflX [Clostridiales bacterium]